MQTSRRTRCRTCVRNARQPKLSEPPRGFIAEWTVTIILLLFGTTTLVQAFVIPTGSMEDTLLVGDHLLVDKLAFAPAGVVHETPAALQRTSSRRHHRFPLSGRYQADVRQARDGRGRRPYPSGEQEGLPQRPSARTSRTWCTRLDYIDSYRDNFPTDPNTPLYPPAQAMLEHNVKNGEVVVPPGYFFAMGDNRDQSLDSRYWGFVPRENIIGKPLIIYWSYDASTEELSNPAVSISHLFDIATHFLDKTRWNRDAAADSFLSGSIDCIMAESEPLRPDSGRRAGHAILAAQPQTARQTSAQRHGRAHPDPGHGGSPAPVIPPERIWILTNDFVRDEIVRQLPEVPPSQIIAEPAQRNTAPAIALAAHILQSIDPKAVFGVFPSDHVIGLPKRYLAVSAGCVQSCGEEAGSRVLGNQAALARDRHTVTSSFPKGTPADALDADRGARASTKSRS